MHIKPLICLLLGSFCLSCKNDPPSHPPAQRIAKAFCDCASHLIILNQKAEAMRTDTVPLNLDELSMEYEKVKECAGIIIGQNGGRLKPDLMHLVHTAMLEKCPEVAKQNDLIQEMLAE